MNELNHYKLRDGNVQIAFSGGRTSAYMLHQILEANGDLPERAQVTFQNTGREMPETLDFVQECAQRTGTRITWLEYAPRRPLKPTEIALVDKHFGHEYAAQFEDWWTPEADGFARVSHNSAARQGEPFLALILNRRFLPNQQARFCTTELKVRTAKRYLRKLGWDYWTNCIGIRADEPSRLKPEDHKIAGDRWWFWQPLANAGVSKQDVALFWRRQPFDLQLRNLNGKSWLGNCDGCFLKSEANVAALAREIPDRAAWWEQAEAIAADLTSGSAATFSKRYNRAEMRRFMERQGDFALSTEGMLCQKDDGECTT